MKNIIFTEYINIQGKDATHLKCELYYSLGGFNCFTHEEEPRGYYVSVSPIRKADGFESYWAFSGYKQIVQPCARRSKKQQAAAEEKYIEVRNLLCDHLIKDNDYKIDTDTAEQLNIGGLYHE